jgi:hypothetical protein
MAYKSNQREEGMGTCQICNKTNFFVGTGRKAMPKTRDGSKEGLENTVFFIFPVHCVHQNSNMQDTTQETTQTALYLSCTFAVIRLHA